MSRLVLFFLSCFMCMAMLACEDIPIPTNAMDPNLQCEFSGFAGLCHNLMFTDGEFNCRNLICASPFRTNTKTFRGRDIGPAVDGTPCGEHKMCIRGSCTELPPNMQLLQPLNPSGPGILCHRTVEGKPMFYTNAQEHP